jgi:hypothetical protein
MAELPFLSRFHACIISNLTADGPSTTFRRERVNVEGLLDLTIDRLLPACYFDVYRDLLLHLVVSMATAKKWQHAQSHTLTTANKQSISRSRS